MEVAVPRRGTRVSAEVWRERVERWKASGLSSKDFAKQEGIGRPQALSWWANQLKRKSGEDSMSSAPIVRVVKLGAGEQSPRADEVDIVLPSGARVAVGPQSNERALQLALRVLGARP
jgi:hypothetical protein